MHKAAVSSSAGCDKEDACATSDEAAEAEAEAAPNGTAERGQLLVSRSDYKVRVMERSSGRQRWNVSLAQYSLEVVPPPGELPPRPSPSMLRLQLLEDNALCASASPHECSPSFAIS